ncbi:hypothetical protein [Thermoplasma sp.]|uniref:hypothetical protein n=1 Tax=Thermoplasma sp. TaxID=1973142 RepID=UPI00126CC8E9|nr:hypothetical protein [Thermoplasma sp.]KAA8922764.1 MAG: hypothetical protein F6Q11_03115 [Thermoplasma sp.]
MKPIMVGLIVAIVLAVVFAGAFGYADYSNAKTNTNYQNAVNTANGFKPDAVLGSAFEHWDYIAIENTTLVMEQYAPDAVLHWVNGSLNGTYNNYSSINATWNKFFAAWIAVWFYSEEPPMITVKGDMAYVNATVQFVLQKNSTVFDYINVSYEIVYQNMGFNVKTGQFQYQIIYEVFNILGGSPKPLSEI